MQFVLEKFVQVGKGSLVNSTLVSEGHLPIRVLYS